jgi:predicted RecA/RadA family phage recombinase
MAKKYIQPGDVLDHVAVAVLTSGIGVLIGKRLGVALGNAAIGDTVALQVKGVFDMPKLSTDVIAQGDLLYWDNTNKRLTSTATSNTLAGYAAAASASGVATVHIALNA